MRSALGSALQANGAEALRALRSLDEAQLAPRYAPTRLCMLERLGKRSLPASAVSDRFVAQVLAAYQEYWLRSLLAEHPPDQNDAWLLSAVNDAVETAGGKKAADLDALEATLEPLITSHGYHVLLGMTRPLRELMLWKTETQNHYQVALPAGVQPVVVVFMGDFASLGWAGFATCDRHHSGGWTKPDRLFAVRSAYELDSENFRVSYLAHEAQHYFDNKHFPKLEDQAQLEYRAKLVELATAKTSAYELLETFAGNTTTDASVPHSFANGRVVRDMAARLFPAGTATPAWRRIAVGKINSTAVALLRQDTARLRRAQQ
jgi:hypothetical protein